MTEDPQTKLHTNPDGTTVEVPFYTKIGKGVWFEMTSDKLSIGRSVQIDDDVIFYDEPNSIDKLEIGDRVFIGQSARISPGVEIGPKVKIFEGVFIGHNVKLSQGSRVGANTYIYEWVDIGVHASVGVGCHVMPGTKIPTNWMIPDSYVVNPANPPVALKI